MERQPIWKSKEREVSVAVELTPCDVSTQGYLNIREWDEKVVLRFLPHECFRGKLIAVEWNIQDNVKHRLTPEDEDFHLFEQVGERPEIRCPMSFFRDLKLPQTVLLRIKFEFDTFRAEPNWFGFLYFKNTYGDMEADSDAAYKIPRPKSGGCCPCDCDCCPEESDCEDYCEECPCADCAGKQH